MHRHTQELEGFILCSKDSLTTDSEARVHSLPCRHLDDHGVALGDLGLQLSASAGPCPA